MIYSDDINKICALCQNASKADEDGNMMHCSLKNADFPASTPDCGKFKYDIFKKVVRRKRQLNTEFSPEDFTLD